MRNFFPNIETAVIAIFILCVALWGASRCKKKKEEASLRNATESSVSLIDTVSSPAATRNTTTVPPLPPRTVATAPVADPSTPPPSTINNPNGIPQSYSTTPTPLPSSPTTVRQTPVPMPSTTPVPMPSTTPTTPQMGGRTPTTPTTTTTPKAATVEQGGASLYVLINGLNVRGKPDLKAKSLGKLKLNDQVTFMQEVTDIPQPVRLANGTTVSKPWFKIKTKRGTIGWVHGSGVDFYKRKPTEGL